MCFLGVRDNSYHYFRNRLNINNVTNLHCCILAGIAGGSCQTIIDNPIETLKINIMTNKKLKFSDFIQNKGFYATLIRNVGFAICISSLCFGKENRSDLSNFGHSASAGVVGCVLTQPIDYVKTQQQRSNDTRSIYNIFADTYKDSPKKLFTGCFNRSLLSFFSMGIGYLAYDKIYKLLN